MRALVFGTRRRGRRTVRVGRGAGLDRAGRTRRGSRLRGILPCRRVRPCRALTTIDLPGLVLVLGLPIRPSARSCCRVSGPRRAARRRIVVGRRILDHRSVRVLGVGLGSHRARGRGRVRRPCPRAASIHPGVGGAHHPCSGARLVRALGRLSRRRRARDVGRSRRARSCRRTRRGRARRPRTRPRTCCAGGCRRARPVGNRARRRFGRPRRVRPVRCSTRPRWR